MERLLATREIRLRQMMSEKLAYDTGKWSRARKNYHEQVGSANHELSRVRAKVVQLCRQLSYNSPAYQAFKRCLRGRVLGTGLVPIPENDAAEAAVSVFVREAWEGKALDMRRQHSFGKMQRLIFDEAFDGGDVLMVHAVDSAGVRGVQLVESERLRAPGSANDVSPTMVEGVEIDRHGRAIGYWIDEWDLTESGTQHNPQPVEARFCRLYAHLGRMNQWRGNPLLAVGAIQIVEVHEFLETVALAAKLQAAVALLSKGPDPAPLDEALAAPKTAEGRALASAAGMEHGINAEFGSIADMEPGQVLALFDDQDVKALQPTQPNAIVEQFVKTLLRMSCAVLGMPYEVVMGDMAKISLSTVGALLTTAHEAALEYREDFAADVCQWNFRWWLAEALASGRLAEALNKARAEAEKEGRAWPGDELDTLAAVQWSGPPRPIVDEIKWAQGAKIRIENNLATKEQVVTERGGRLEKILDQRQYEVGAEAKRGITPPKMPGQDVSEDDDASGGGGETPDPEAGAHSGQV